MAFDPSKIVIPESVKQRGLRGASQLAIDTSIREINALPGSYKELKDAQKAGITRGLEGLGNYLFGDDPSTPEKEGEYHVYRADKRIGDRERNAVHNENSKANARGLFSSSFRDKGVGDALGRLTREAQQVITEYATSIKALDREQADKEQALYDVIGQTYVGEVDYLKENPDKPSEAEINASVEATKKADDNTSDLSPHQLLAKEQGWLGPWDKKPTLGAGFNVFLRHGKWFAVRK